MITLAVRPKSILPEPVAALPLDEARGAVTLTGIYGWEDGSITIREFPTLARVRAELADLAEGGAPLLLDCPTVLAAVSNPEGPHRVSCVLAPYHVRSNPSVGVHPMLTDGFWTMAGEATR